MSCPCILQSGPRSGERCGARLKPNTTTCGRHRNQCFKRKSTSPHVKAKRKSPSPHVKPKRKSPVKHEEACAKCQAAIQKISLYNK